MSDTSTVSDICCIGHITHDRVVNPGSVVEMPGGTAFYFSKALAQMPLQYQLVTALAETELQYAEQLRQEGIQIAVLPSRNTVFFENSYSDNPDHRTQRVLQQADSLKVADIKEINACYYHLGPLLAADFAPGVVEHLAAKGRVSLDVQGLLRRVADQKVEAIDWADKETLLPCVHTLKANEVELEVLTRQTDIRRGAQMLAQMGVKEVVITLGSEGSLIYTGESFCSIPAYKPAHFKDATGCGDTYMAGYLFKRSKGADVEEAGYFASAMAGVKAGISGAFIGTEEQVLEFMKQNNPSY